MTGPFHHQYEPWMQTDYQLYYYPGYGYFDHPLYTSYRQVVHYGDKRFRRQPVRGLQEGKLMKRRRRPTVEVYVGDEYLGNMDRQVLTKFSGVARSSLGNGHRRSASSAGSDSGVDFSSIRMRAASSPATKSPIQISTSSSSGDKSSPYQKALRFELPVSQLPTTAAVLYTLAWIKSQISSYEATLPFGPTDLHSLPLDQLLDLYQAALLFGLRPWPLRLQIGLHGRLLRERLSIEQMRNIANWIPLDDIILATAIHSFEDKLLEGRYEKWEMQRFKRMLREPGMERLREKVTEVRKGREEWLLANEGDGVGEKEGKRVRRRNRRHCGRSRFEQGIGMKRHTPAG